MSYIIAISIYLLVLMVYSLVLAHKKVKTTDDMVTGGDITDYEYETLNAAAATVTVNGFSIHPGTSKDKLKNALLPAMETPGHTEGYEGFYHLQEMHGKVESSMRF